MSDRRGARHAEKKVYRRCGTAGLEPISRFTVRRSMRGDDGLNANEHRGTDRHDYPWAELRQHDARNEAIVLALFK
jgi:hypothetical protein